MRDSHSTSEAAPYEPLTERERDILKLLMLGLTDREIANRLVVAYTTVKWYNKQIFNKLGVKNRREATERVQALRLLEEAKQEVEPKQNLPTPTTPFVGRGAELDDLLRLFRDENVRLLTILAPGGMGKTRLALAAARLCLHLKRSRSGSMPEPLFHDGVYYIPLVALQTGEHILSTVAHYIGFQFTPDDRPPMQQIIDFLRHKRLLLILDSFEHLLDSAILLSNILHNAPDVKIVVTSRERLNLNGETIYTLGGMTVPDQTSVEVQEYDAVRLFVQSAQHVQPHFALDKVRYDVVRVCQLAYGMPLAIELAAAWVGTLSATEIADEIAQNVDFLRTTMRDMPERLRSVRAVFETTWQRLTEEQRAAFRHLSVMRGGASREAAQIVSGTDLGTLSELVNKALFRRDPTSGRYEIHELLRQYAERELIDNGERDNLSEAHSKYYLNVLALRRAALEGGSQVEALRDIQGDIENVRAAWIWAAEHGDTSRLSDALYSLWLYFEIRGLYAEGEAIFGQAVSSLRSIRLEVEQCEVLANLLARQASFSTRLGQIEKTQKLLDASEELITPTTSLPVRAFLAYTHGLSRLESRFEEPLAARPFLRQSLSLYQAIGLRWESAYTMAALADSLWYGVKDIDSDYSEAVRLYTEALEGQTAIGDLVGLSQTLLSLGGVLGILLPIPQPEAARQHLKRSIELRRQFGHKAGVSAALSNLGAMCLHLGNFTEAQKHLEESLAIRREVGNVHHVIQALTNLSYVSFEAGDFIRARSSAEEASILVARIEDDSIAAQVSCGLAAANWTHGAYAQSAEHFRSTKMFADDTRSPHPRSLALIAIDASARAGMDFDRERQHYQQHLQREQVGKDLSRDSFLHAALGEIAWHEGDVSSAVSHLETSHDCYTNKARTRYSRLSELDLAQMDIFVLTTLAQLECIRGQGEAAYHHTEAALELARRFFIVPYAFKCLVVAARWYAAQNQLLSAVKFCELVQNNAQAFAADREAAHALLSTIEEHLTAEAFTTAIEQGRLMTLEAAVDMHSQR